MVNDLSGGLKLLLCQSGACGLLKIIFLNTPNTVYGVTKETNSIKLHSLKSYKTNCDIAIYLLSIITLNNKN